MYLEMFCQNLCLHTNIDAVLKSIREMSDRVAYDETDRGVGPLLLGPGDVLPFVTTQR